MVGKWGTKINIYFSLNKKKRLKKNISIKWDQLSLESLFKLIEKEREIHLKTWRRDFEEIQVQILANGHLSYLLEECFFIYFADFE